MDLLENVAQELEFDFRLYIVADGLFGSRTVVRTKNRRDVGKKFLSYRFKDDLTRQVHGEREERSEEGANDVKWNGIVGDLVSGAAHMSFAGECHVVRYAGRRHHLSPKQQLGLTEITWSNSRPPQP